MNSKIQVPIQISCPQLEPEHHVGHPNTADLGIRVPESPVNLIIIMHTDDMLQGPHKLQQSELRWIASLTSKNIPKKFQQLHIDGK